MEISLVLCIDESHVRHEQDEIIAFRTGRRIDDGDEKQQKKKTNRTCTGVSSNVFFNKISFLSRSRGESFGE